jgi:predicted unusual protein kinase regulating ubiquinone biosynthesis (AarF/ABC1/UbiB family)
MNRKVLWLKWRRILILVGAMPRAIRAKIVKDDDAFYTHVCDTMLQLGGIYIKFLQGVLLQSDVMKHWQGNGRWKVFEAVDIDEIDVFQTLKKELKSDPKQIFQTVDETPFAAGSFGQVYHAYLIGSNERVIVKILRPHMKSILKFDLRVLSMIARLLSNDFTSLDVDFSSAVKEFRTATLRETDYKAEVGFALEMQEYFCDHSAIFIPKTYQEYSTNQIIVQEYVEGISVAEVIKAQHQYGQSPEEFTYQHTGSDIRYLMKVMATDVLVGFFAAERMPGDLHPGNLRIMTGNRIGIIDFGISASKPRYPHIFYRLLKQLTHVKNDGSTAGDMFVTYLEYFAHDLYRAMQRISMHFGYGQTLLIEYVKSYAQDLFDKKTDNNFHLEQEIQHSTMFGAHVNKVVNDNNRFCITTRVDFVDLLRAVQSLIAVIDTLAYRNLIEDIFGDVYKRVNADFPQYTKEPPNRLSINVALDIISKWLEKLLLRNPELFFMLKQQLQILQKNGIEKT